MNEDLLENEAVDLAEDLFMTIIDAYEGSELDDCTFAAISHVAFMTSMALNMASMELKDGHFEAFMDETMETIRASYLDIIKLQASEVPPGETLQ